VFIPVAFRDYSDQKVYRIEGLFSVSDPWWSATLDVTGGHNKRLVGCRSLKLRSDELVAKERVVWLFIMACTTENFEVKKKRNKDNRKKESTCKAEVDAFFKALT